MYTLRQTLWGDTCSRHADRRQIGAAACPALAHVFHLRHLGLQGRLVDAAGSAGSVSKSVRNKAAQMEGEDGAFDFGASVAADQPTDTSAGGLGDPAAAAAAVGGKPAVELDGGFLQENFTLDVALTEGIDRSDPHVR